MADGDAAASSRLQRVAIIGCGLIGGSLALANARDREPGHVTVWDRSPEVLARARDRLGGVVVCASLGDAVRDADLVVLAIPAAELPTAAEEVARAARRAPILTDVASVKARPVREIEGLRLEGIRFIGGHPMAGSERSGVQAADPLLFQGATWVLTPTPASDMTAFDRLGAHLRSLGARVLAVEPAVHDRLVAIASHLPQMLASTLMLHASEASRTSGAGVLAIAAGGFRDVTRIAASDPELWIGILRDNRAAVLDALRGFRERLDTAAALLEADDAEGLGRILGAARDARLELPAKERAGELVDLVVALDDRPGVLAEVTTALGEAGVNIEDLAMRHATEVAGGALIVAVDGHAAAERATGLLTARGFSSHLEPRGV